jgi:beta-N-acetylhexosaminidase
MGWVSKRYESSDTITVWPSGDFEAAWSRSAATTLAAMQRLRLSTPFTVHLCVAVVVAALAVSCTGTSSGEVAQKQVKKATASTTTTLPPDCAEVLPPSAQAGQMIMVMVASPQIATEVLTTGTAGGFALKGKQSKDIAEEVAAATAQAPVAAFVASDEEGGTVQRLSSTLGVLPSAESLAKGTPTEASVLLEEYSTGMRELGFNMIFGPVADVGSGSGLGTRTFGTDPAVVTEFTDAIINAELAGGLIPVVKHWPGIGGGTADPHVMLGKVAALDALKAKDLVPFASAIANGVPAIMVTHVQIPGITAPGEPASLSRAAITSELREQQGFEGLIITDDLSMKAVASFAAQPKAAELAIAAGADIALVSTAESVPKVHAQITDAITSERLDKQQVVASVRRILATKGITGSCPDLAANLSSIGVASTTSTTANSSPANSTKTTSTAVTSASN